MKEVAVSPDEAAALVVAKALGDRRDSGKPISRRTMKRARRAVAAIRELRWRPGSTPTDAERARKAEAELADLRKFLDRAATG